MKSKTAAFVLVATMVVCSGLVIAATDGPGILEGKSLLGKPLYTNRDHSVNVGSADALKRAATEAKAAYERDPTVDSATWYSRLLGYQGLMRESIAVCSAALKKFPDSGKLLRHRAQHYFSVREFKNSITDALRAVALYQGKPLEREKLGPKYFPAEPDVVQFYLFYHLGQAYLAEHQFDKAAKAFGQSRQIALGVNDPSSVTAATYWEYISLARNQRYDDARHLLDGYSLTLIDLRDNTEPNTYFDGIELFKNLRDPESFYNTKDSGKAFGSADGTSASSAYTLANYYLLQGDSVQGKKYLRKAAAVKTWAYFAVIQAEAEWVWLYPGEAL